LALKPPDVSKIARSHTAGGLQSVAIVRISNTLKAVLITTLFLTIAAAVAGGQTPWTTTGSFIAPVTAAAVTGPMLAAPNGDLYVANSMVGSSQATGQFGDFSTASTWLSHISASGTPVYADRIGGVYRISALGVDGSGNALVAGYGPPSGLPVTPGAWISSPSGQQTAFACKFDPATGTPIFCTYLNADPLSIAAIGADAAGNVYILETDGVILKLDPTGTKLLFAASFGASLSGSPRAMVVDSNGNVYITGVINSTNPASPGSFIAKVDSSGTKLLYQIFGVPDDYYLAIAVDDSGAAYVAGVSLATGSVVATKVTSDGTHIAYHTSLPPNPNNSNPSIAVDGNGNAIVVGSTTALALTHVLTATCRLANLPYPSTGAAEAFMVRIAPDGTVLQSTYVGTGTTPVAAVSITSGSSQAWIAVTGQGLTGVGVLQVAPGTLDTSSTSIGCMSNAATFATGALSPGEIFSIFGEGLGPSAATAATLSEAGQFPTLLAGVQVVFDDIPAPLLYVQDGQINAITPWELAGKATSKMCVAWQAKTSCATIVLGPAAPGIFTSNGVLAAAVNQDGTINSLSNPAHFGSIVSLYLTGLGPLTPSPADGSLIQLPLPSLVYPVAVTFSGGQNPVIGGPGKILYSGAAPLEVGGMFQINVRVPAFPATLFVEVQLPDGSVARSPYANIATGP
jgi:uncharacterized protein (TIGR03437 family)